MTYNSIATTSNQYSSSIGDYRPVSGKSKSRLRIGKVRQDGLMEDRYKPGAPLNSLIYSARFSGFAKTAVEKAMLIYHTHPPIT